MSEIWFFEKVNLFDIFCPNKFAGYSNNSQFRDFEKGEFIYFSDDIADQIYLVTQGKIKVLYYTESGEEIVKNVLSKGDIFGELAILGEERRKDFAQSSQDKTSVCQLSIDQMKELMKDDKPFALRINKLIGLRIQKLERRLDALVFKDARTRLLDFIKELVAEKGTEEDGRLRVEHSLTHKDIADLTGTSRQTVTTLLNELKNEGLIDFERKAFFIPDLSLLG